jgi:hypothetical protein
MLECVRVNRNFAAATLWTPAIVLFMCLVAPSLSMGQDTKSTEDRIKTLERERDELKKRSGILELRLKQLQATVNQQVTDALGPNLGGRGSLSGQASEPAPVPHPPGEPASSSGAVTPQINYFQAAPWRSIGPPFTRSAGIFSPLQSPVDLVSLSVAYQDALGELRRSRQAKASKENRPAVDLESAESKVRLLRSITKAVRDQLAEEVDRMHKLSAIHAVPSMDVRNLDTKLRILDLILAQDPDAGPVSSEPAGEKPAAPTKAE